MSILQTGDKIFIDHPDSDGVTLTDPTVWRARPGGNGQPPQQRNITADVREVTVSSQTITVTGKDGSRAKASHAPESSPGMRTGIVESVQAE